jgi:hypothetical protein
MSKRPFSNMDDFRNPERSYQPFSKLFKHLKHSAVFVAKKKNYQCIICPRHQPQNKRGAKRHEDTDRHVQALRARSEDGNNSTMTTAQESPTLSFSTSFPSIHGPALAGDHTNQLYHSYSHEPSPAVQETILSGALESLDPNYKTTALDLGTLLTVPSEQTPESSAASDDDDACSTMSSCM